MSEPIRISLLGRFEVARQTKSLRAEHWTRRKAATLLQRLALSRRLLKDEAIDFLWPQADLISGANNLYRTLHNLRQTLDRHLGPGAADETFAFLDGVLALKEAVVVDAGLFERNARAALGQSAARPADLVAVLEPYAGDLLPDELYADWTQAPRQALRDLQREVSLALAESLIAARQPADAIARLTPLLARDPADELVHRALMRAYALAGRRHDALRQYQACADALHDELDVPPDAETTALYAQILSGELLPEPAAAPEVDEARAWTPRLAGGLTAQASTPLIGREVELEQLHEWLQPVTRGHGQTVLLAGEAGVGKTHLATQVLQAAAAAGLTTMAGAAYEQEGQLPYQPFIEAADDYLARPRQASDGARPAAPHQNPITHFKRRAGDPQQDQWALFNAMAAFLAELAERAPVVLLVDDLHAADEASLRLFHYLARQTRGARVLLLATYRRDLAPAASPVGALINALYRERLSETLSLGPLSHTATAQMMAHELGGPVAPELQHAVYEVTEGNAFFVQEVTRALQQTGQVERREGQWHLAGTLPPGAAAGRIELPAGLTGLVRQQVARLGSPVEATLGAAAVIGREFAFDVLRGLTAVSESELLDALDMAIATHLLTETSRGYRFRHILIRHALYDSLTQTRRARLHGSVAARIEALYAQRQGGLDAHVEDLAFHYALSDRRERALENLIQAGRKAARLYAYEVAVHYYERALDVLDELGLAAPEQRFRLLESLGKYHKVLADTPRAVAAFERALQLSGAEWAPQPCDRARVRRLAAMGLLTAGQLDEAAHHLHAALTELDEAGEHPELANVLYNVAQLHWHRNEYQAAFDVAQRSLAVAERLDDAAAIARAFEMLALACHSLGEWQTGIAFEERRAALAGPGLDVTDAFDVHL